MYSKIGTNDPLELIGSNFTLPQIKSFCATNYGCDETAFFGLLGNGPGCFGPGPELFPRGTRSILTGEVKSGLARDVARFRMMSI